MVSDSEVSHSKTTKVDADHNFANPLDPDAQRYSLKPTVVPSTVSTTVSVSSHTRSSTGFAAQANMDSGSPHDFPRQQTDIDALTEQLDYIFGTLRNVQRNAGSDPLVKDVIEHYNSKILGVILGKPQSEHVSPPPSVESKLKLPPSRQSDASSDSPPVSPRTARFFHSNQNTKPRFKQEVSDTNHLYGASAVPLSSQTAHQPTTIDTLAEALSRLDNRQVPRPQEFDLSSGQSFEFFLSTFEEYCNNTFRGSSSLWSVELGRFLKGSLKEAYDAFFIPGEAYLSLKAKMIQWCKDSSESISRSKRKRFEKAKIQLGESQRLYAARLEREFRLAYPHKNSMNSTALRRKFLESSSKAFRKHVASAKSIMAMSNIELDWPGVLALASSYDANLAELRSSTDTDIEPDITEVWAATTPRPEHFHEQYFQQSPYTNPATTTRTTMPAAQSYSPRRTQVQRNFLRSPPSPTGNDSRTCHHCNIQGHIKPECWRFNGFCLVCGSNDHRVSQCPKRRSLQQSLQTQDVRADNQMLTNNQPNQRRVTFDGFPDCTIADRHVQQQQGNSTAPTRGSPRRS
jgi:hypothetical protein